MKTLLKTAAATTATAVAGAIATEPDTLWYRTRRKPPWQPPAIAFPVVWTALYADIAVTSAVVIDTLADDPRRSKELAAFRRALALNLGLNGAWSWLFWRSRRPWLAAAEAAALTLSSWDLARRAHRVRPAAGAALAPYALWCGFATLLATDIAARNE